MPEANADLRRLDLTPRGGADVAARRRAIFVWNVWDAASPFRATRTAKALRDDDPPFTEAQDVYDVLYREVQ